MPTTITRRSSAVETKDAGIKTRLWTRKEYHRAAEVGLFRPDERLELLDGEILVKVTVHPPHACSLRLTEDQLRASFTANTEVRTRLPIVLSNRSEPQPDVAVVRGRVTDYSTEHPTAADALLVIEIADSSLRLDRGRKRVAYARAGISEYWIVNIPQRQLEVFREPTGRTYRNAFVRGEGETMSPLALPGATLRVVDLLPPAASSSP